MTSQQRIEDTLQNLKPLLYQKYHVKKIGYFGSYAKNTAQENSDIDILVEFEKALAWDFFELQDLLEKHLQQKIDLVSMRALKTQLKESILEQTIFV